MLGLDASTRRLPVQSCDRLPRIEPFGEVPGAILELAMRNQKAVALL
jgi:hypothetical protein